MGGKWAGFATQRASRNIRRHDNTLETRFGDGRQDQLLLQLFYW